MASFFEWLKSTVSSISGGESHSSRSEQNTFPRVYDSQLEDRRVLNAGAVVSAIDLVSLRFDAGKSANDGAADKFELIRLDSSNGANQIAVSINNQCVWQGSTTEFQSIRLDGSSDVDQFFIDPSIQVSAGIYVNGTGAATGPQSLGSTDLVIFATASGPRFDEITYQTTDKLTQVRFAFPTNELNQVVQLQNVESIKDLNEALERNIAVEFEGNSNWLLDSSEDGMASEDQIVQLSNDKRRIEFAVPSNRLTIDLQATAASQNSLLIDTMDLSGMEHLKVIGGDTNIVHLNGNLTIGRTLTIEAGTIRVDGAISTGPEGDVQLDARSGVLTVDGEISSRGDDLHRGGSVMLTGDRVLLEEWTRVDVSGGTGGGEIQVGGGYQGKDVSVRNSRYTYVSGNATLIADARINGDGGQVIVWSDDTAIIDGSGRIFARGGIVSGDGGFIETSGKKYLRVDGAANAVSYQGKVGTWLIDPNDIEIVSTAGSAPLTTYILISTINSGLTTGNVSIITNTASAGNGDIRIVDAVSLAPSASRTLTLNATRDIVFQSGLTGNSNLQVSLFSGRDINSTAVTIGQLGDLSIDAARSISVGTINLSGGTFTATIDSNNDDLNATFQSTGALSAGSISISGSTTVNDDVTIGSTMAATTGSIQFTKIDDLTFQGDVTTATNITFTNVAGPLSLGSNVDVTANNGPINFSSITSGIQLAGSNGSVNILTANGATGGLTLGSVTANNPNISLTLRSANDISAGAINIQNGTFDVAFNELNTAGVNVASFNAVTAGRLEISGNSKVDDQVQLNGIATIGTGGVLIDQYNDLEINAALTSAGDITTTGISGSETHLAANVTSNGGNIAMTGGTLLIDGSAARTISSGGGGVAAGGNISLGNVDGENGAANLTVDSRGATTGGAVTLGTVTAATSGLNRLNIRTDAPTTSGQVTLSSTRLVAKGINTATLAVDSKGTTILANGVIDLSSSTITDGGSIDFGSSKVAPTSASSTLTLRTSNTSLLGGDGGDITFGGVSNSGVNYFDSLLIDTSKANALKTHGDLDFNGQANPSLAVDGTSGTGITLIGTILKAFSGVLSFLTNPTGASANTSSIDVTKADFKTTQGLTFDTSGGGASTNAGDVLLGDIGVLTAERPTAVTVDTRGSVTHGDLLLDDGTGTSTELHVDGDLNLAHAKIKLTDNAVLRTYGTGNMTLGDVNTSTAVPRNLTLNSEANIAVAAINLTGGALDATVDSDNDNSNATFQSTGALSAGSISISGSTTVNDNVTIGSTMAATTGSIQFTKIDDLSFQGDVTAATNITFTNVAGPLSLSTNVDVTANNGPMNFAAITSGIQLAGSNGSTNILTANGATGSLTLANVSATNSDISLTLSSSTNTAVGSVNIQNGTLNSTIDTDNNNVGSTFVSTGPLSAGSISISGSTTINDDVTLGSTVTTSSGAIQVSQFDDLWINGDWTSAGGITTTGMSSSKTHLAANITSNGGNIAMTGGTLLVNGTSVRQIKTGGATANAINGGSLTLGEIDGEVDKAELEIDSRGTTTSGDVTLGTVFAAASNKGLNRLLIVTDGPTAGQVSLSSIRLIAKAGTPASLTVTASGRTILADGTIDLSSNAIGQAGGNVTFGNSAVAPKSPSSTLTMNTSNTNPTSGVDGSNGGNIALGGIGVNATGSSYFNSVNFDLSAADILDSMGTLSFGSIANPSVQVDGVMGTGIRILGKVDNTSGGVLRFLTNPAGVTQNSSAIDMSRASFISSGGLVFDTSGNNLALDSGSVSLGDIGTIVRPVSLIVDTRGTVSSGYLILNDGVTGSPTQILIDGTIDFSNIAVDLLDDVLLQSHIDGNKILLGTTSASGGSRNLQLGSDSDVTVDAINLSGGAFQANVDTNDNEVGASFRSNSEINAGSLAVGGSAANNDIASIGANITTTGQVSFSNLDQLRIQGTITAGTTFIASNITGAVGFSGIAGITANGSIDLRTSVNAVVLSGIAGSTTLIDAKGNASLVSLASVNAPNPGTRLNVRSDYSVDLSNVDLQSGILDVLIGRSTTLTDSKAQLRQVVAGELVVTGTSTANNSVVLDGLLDIGTGGVIIQNLAKLDVNFNVQSDGDIIAKNVRDRIRVAEAVSVRSNRGVNLQLNVGQIQLVGGIVALTNLFRANGDSSSLQLASILALQDVVLVLSSANNINIASIDARGSSLAIQVDNNNNTPGSRLDSGQIQVSQMSIQGGATLDDIANLTGLVESKSGSVLVSSFHSVDLIGDLLSSSSLEISSISGRVNIGAGRLVKAFNGDVTLNNSLNEIRFVGGAGTSSSIQSVNGSLFASSLTEANASSLIELRADRSVVLQSSLLNSNLQIVAGDHNSNTGTINSSATLAAASISLNAATGIGTSFPVVTSTNNISASNRLGGVVQIANSNAGTVTVSNLVANEGGNIGFAQSGGGVVRFQNVASNPDGSPAGNEGNIALSNSGGNLIVEGAGVSAGGLGNVGLETQTAGDIQLVAATRANGGTIGIRSAQRIIGSGALHGLAVNLDAMTGIGTTGAIQTEAGQLSVNSQINSVDVRNLSAALTNVSQLRSGGSGTVQFRQVGGGDVAFSSVATGSATSNAGSNISLRNDNGSVFIQGSVVAGGGGSIRFDAQNNLIIGAGAIVQTNGVNATIKGVSGGKFLFASGAIIRAGSSNANTEAVVSRVPPLASAQPTVNPLGVNVDSQGIASIQIQLGGPNPALIDRNFSVVIDWGDREIDNFPDGSMSPLTINPRISRFDASGVVYEITHQYLGNPKPNDPIADIPVTVTIGIDALNRIKFNDSQGPVTSLTIVVNQNFVVPAAGLFSLRFDLPQGATLQNRIVFSNSVSVQPNSIIAPLIASVEIVVSSESSAVEKVRTYVLRVITPVNEQGEVESSEDIALTDEDILDLSSGKLFQRLGDNRYRIYLIREDGNQLLLKDFYLRNHRPIEIDDAPTTANEAPTNERVLDKDTSATSPRKIGGLVEVRGGEPEVIGPKVIGSDVVEPDEIENKVKSEEKPMANATLAMGTVAQAMRSWRKAARRFRAS